MTDAAVRAPRERSRCARWTAVAVASAVASTLLVRTGVLPLSAFGASPQRVAEGKDWLLLTSALVADDPVVAALISFAAFAAVALRVLGPRLFVVTALLGHVGSTVLVYGLIAAARAVQPSAFEAVLNHTDHGQSAMQAAWLGAVAAVAWTHRRSRLARATIAASCVLVGIVAWLVRPDLTILDLDHGFACGLGIATAVAVQASADRLQALARTAFRGGRQGEPIAAPRARVREADPSRTSPRIVFTRLLSPPAARRRPELATAPGGAPLPGRRANPERARRLADAPPRR